MKIERTYPDSQIIPDATDPHLRNRIDRQPLDYLKADLVICVNALMEMRESKTSSPLAAMALRDLYLPIECGACGGQGKRLCSHCRGGGTSEHPCQVCNNSHEQTCQECDGSGVV